MSETRVIVVYWRNARGDERRIPNVDTITNLRFNVGSMNMSTQPDNYILFVFLNNIKILLQYSPIPKYLPWIFIWILGAFIIIIQTWWYMHHHNILFTFFHRLCSICFQRFIQPIYLILWGFTFFCYIDWCWIILRAFVEEIKCTCIPIYWI